MIYIAVAALVGMIRNDSWLLGQIVLNFVNFLSNSFFRACESGLSISPLASLKRSSQLCWQLCWQLCRQPKELPDSEISWDVWKFMKFLRSWEPRELQSFSWICSCLLTCIAWLCGTSPDPNCHGDMSRYVTIRHNVPWTLCTVQCSHCALPSGLGHNHLI